MHGKNARGDTPGRGRNLVVALVAVVAAALAFGMVGAFGNEQDKRPQDCPDGYSGPGYGGPGYGGPGYGGPGYGGPGYNGYGGPPDKCPPCPPPGNGNGNGHDKDRGNGHGDSNGRGHCKDDTPEARFAYSPKPAQAGEPVHFDASASDDDASDPIVSYQWDFDGDGQFDDGSGQQIDHTFAQPGKYDVGLLVTDNSGDTDTAVETVHVQEKTKPPKANTDPPAAPRKEDPEPEPPKAKDDPPKPSVKAAPNQSLTQVLSKGLVVIATCSENCKADLSVAVQSKGTKKAAAAAKAKANLPSGTKTKLRVKLSKKVRQALRRSKKATFVITLAVRDSAGNASSATRRVSLTR